MALPKLNSTLLYKTTVPSTGETVEFRPFLVGEEKLFLIASQSMAPRVLYDVIKRVVAQCVTTEGFDVTQLKGYDLDYMFLQLRAKSVGEQETLNLSCGSCETKNVYDIDFENGVYVSKGPESNKVDLGGGITLGLIEPGIDDVIEIQEAIEDQAELAFAMLDLVIDKVYTAEEVMIFHDESREERQSFVQSMTADQMQLILAFIQEIPQVSMDVSFVCGNCGQHNQTVLKGVSDFFA
jgi:hypothetical protein